MALTINEMYQAAANGETSWEHALLLTGLLYMREAGLEVSPPPSNENEECNELIKSSLTVLSSSEYSLCIHKSIPILSLLNLGILLLYTQKIVHIINTNINNSLVYSGNI